MKKLYFALSFLTLSSVSFSQDTESLPTASCSEEFCVQLDGSLPIQEFYKIDIGSFEFATYEDAQKKFGYISNNLLTYKVNFADEEVVLQVHTDRTPESQDLVWWNEYLTSLCGL